MVSDVYFMFGHLDPEGKDPHSGSKAPYKGDSRNHGLFTPYVYVVFWAPILRVPRIAILRSRAAGF